jgi:hypothetical protein
MEAYEGADGMNECSTPDLPRTDYNIVYVTAKNFEMCMCVCVCMYMYVCVCVQGARRATR